jgi:hypothetical protein
VTTYEGTFRVPAKRARSPDEEPDTERRGPARR